MSTEESKVSLIKSHLFENLSGIRNIKPKNRDVSSNNMHIVVAGEDGTTTYLDVQPINRIDEYKCKCKINKVILEKDFVAPLSIGVDAFSSPTFALMEGNATFAMIKVLTAAVDGDVSEKLLEDIKRNTKHCLMLSNREFEENEYSVDHVSLQDKDSFENMFKVVKEGYMISESLKNIVKTLKAYHYGKTKSVIIMKDGPLLADWNEAFGDALLSNKFSSRLEDNLELYKSVLDAGFNKIPIIGITKFSTRNILSKHYGEPNLNDKSILKSICKDEKFSYIGPFEWKHKNNSEFKLLYFYVYLGKIYEPLRVEILANSLPAELSPENIVEQLIKILILKGVPQKQNSSMLFLPPCIARSDEFTREQIKKKKEEIWEVMIRIKHKLGHGIVVKAGGY
jgi:hypothetical protein